MSEKPHSKGWGPYIFLEDIYQIEIGCSLIEYVFLDIELPCVLSQKENVSPTIKYRLFHPSSSSMEKRRVAAHCLVFCTPI